MPGWNLGTIFVLALKRGGIQEQITILEPFCTQWR